MFHPKIMQGLKLRESKIMKKILNIDSFKGENQNSSEARKETPSLNQAPAYSRRHFYHQTKKYEVIVI